MFFLNAENSFCHFDIVDVPAAAAVVAAAVAVADADDDAEVGDVVADVVTGGVENVTL